VRSGTFWGAAGGAALGDLIIPGLGTVGGALLGGGLGRHAGKKSTSKGSRSSSARNQRDKYDEMWEEGKRRRGE
jgi:hypothetical protein